MKFDYAPVVVDGKPVAFIDADHELVILDQVGMFDLKAVCLTDLGSVIPYEEASEVIDMLEDAVQVFYKGDSVTITF